MISDTCFLAALGTSAKLSGKAILGGIWSLTSRPATDTSHLHQCVSACSFQLEHQIKTSLEKSDGVKQEFKAEPYRLLIKHPRPARGHDLETQLGTRDFTTRGESEQVEGLEAGESFKAGVSASRFSRSDEPRPGIQKVSLSQSHHGARTPK